MKLVISADELKQKLNSPEAAKILLLDLSEIDNYQQGTVPGAKYLPYEYLIAGEGAHPHKLPPASKFAAGLAAVGYKPDTQPASHIVAFDDEFGLKAARLYWTMRMAGLSGFSYLNGGLAAWVAAGFEPAPGTDVSAVSADKGTLDLTWSGEYLASANDIHQAITAAPPAEMFLWDARSFPEWSGEVANAERGGRIPGAEHLEWKAFIDEQGKILPQQQVQELLDKFLGNKEQVVAYCQAHRRSAMAFLLADYVGRQIKGYDGSWHEWGNSPNLPLETGDS